MRSFFKSFGVVFLLCMAMPLPAAFAKDDPAKNKIEAGQTVLLLDVIESKPFHRHGGGWVARRLDGNDALLELIRARLASVLTDAGYKTAWETVPEDYVEPIQQSSYLSIGWSSNKVKPKYVPWFRDRMQKHGATSVVIFHTTYDHTFGILSGSGDQQKYAELVANIGAVVLTGDKLEAHTYSTGYRTCVIRIDFSEVGVGSPDQIVGAHLVPFNDRIAALAARNAAEYLSQSGVYDVVNRPCSGAF